MAKATENTAQINILLREEDGEKTIVCASLERSKLIARMERMIRGWWLKGGDFNGMESDIEDMRETFDEGNEWSSPYDCPCTVKRTFRIVTVKAL